MELGSQEYGTRYNRWRGEGGAVGGVSVGRMQLFGGKRNLEGERTMALLTAGTRGSLSSVGNPSRTITRHKLFTMSLKYKETWPTALVRSRETERTERITRQRFIFLAIVSVPRHVLLSTWEARVQV